MQFHVYARALVLIGVAALLGDGKRYMLIVETAKGDWGGTDYDVGYQIQGIQNGRQRHWPEGFWYFENSKNNYEKGSVERWSFDLPDDFHSISSLRVHHKLDNTQNSNYRHWTTNRCTGDRLCRRLQVVDLGFVVDQVGCIVGAVVSRFFPSDPVIGDWNIDRDEVHTFYVENCVDEGWSAWSKCNGDCSGGTRSRWRHLFLAPDLIQPHYQLLHDMFHYLFPAKRYDAPYPSQGIDLGIEQSFLARIAFKTACGTPADHKQTAQFQLVATNGRFCPDAQTEACVTAAEWQAWSSCTVTCGGGKRTRHRKVNEDYKDKCEDEEIEGCGSYEC